MNYILDHSNLKILELLGNNDTFYAFDFDGTLSSIVVNYNEAHASEAVNELMGNICNLAPVAIISGRSVADLKRIINFNPKYLIGNHGMEGILSKEEMSAIEIKCSEWKQFLMNSFYVSFTEAGIEVEDKTFSLSLHYRKAQDPQKAEEMIYNIINLLPEEPRVIKGKFVVNILPFVEINKGFAFKKILNLEKKKFSLFIGDDDTDEDVFNIVDPHCLTIRVGKSSYSKAKYYINSQSEVEILLSKILRLLESQQQTPNKQ